MKIQSSIEEKIKSQLEPSVFEIENESHKHAAQLGDESHFKVFVVSKAFVGKNRVQRQREFHQMVADEMSQGIHALSLRLLTPDEYEKTGSEFKSPNCQSNK